MPDLLRRVAVRTVAFAILMALIVPLSARSATPIAPETRRLLAAASGPSSLLDRGPLGRGASGALSLQEIGPLIAVEALVPPPLPTPGTVTPKVTFGSLAAPSIAVTQNVAPAPTPVTGSTISGEASWYCCTMGWSGQAVVALPGPLGGRYDPPPATRYVTICADRCARLPVVDYCQCYWGTGDQRVADLSPDGWAAVSNANRGVVGIVQVTVHLGG